MTRLNLDQQHAELKAMIAEAKAAKRGTRDLERLLRHVTNLILRRDMRKRKKAA